MVCADGPIVTGGAAFAQTDVMLHLLRQRYASKISDALARVLLIDARAAQAPFVVPEVLASGDHRVAELVARIESALPETISVEALANEFCVSTRTLSRHVYRATGKSTKALMHSVKLRKAKALLEAGRMSIEQVAAAVGYQDSTALRRMMKRVGGANPSAFRKAIR
jgi:transcriptional regulator GlxA family with amidase domain